MTKIEALLAHIQAIFPDKILADYCDSFTAAKIWIEDSEPANKILAHVVLPENLPEEKTFQINNPANKEVVVLAVDGEGIVGKHHSSCDAAFFDEACFCLAEFKYNTTSTNPNSMKGRIRSGLKQLEASIKQLETVKIIQLGYKVEAYFGKPPVYPKINPRIQRKAVEFSNKYSITLKEENSKTF